MRHLLAIATRLGMSRTYFTSAALIVAGISLSSSAQALSFCDSKTPCAAGSQCFGWLCVPTAAVCNPAAPACASWQTCDMTCKIMGSSSGGTSTADAGAAVDGSSGSGSGSSGGSGGSGAVPKPPADGGSSDPMPPPQDAGSSEDVSYPDASYPDDGGGYVPPADCPKNIGVCLPDPVKIVPQPGCEALCTAMGKCGGFGGGNSTDPGEAPPPQPGDAGPAPSVDAGSSTPDAGAGFAPKQEDAAPGDYDASGKMIPPDGGSADVPPPGPDPEQIKSCVMACSVIKLGGYAKVEFSAMEQCIAKGAVDCKTLESNCSKEADAFEDAVKDDEGLQLALMALGGGSSGGGTGVPEPGKDSDAESQTGSDSTTSADATTGSSDIPLGVDAGSTDTSGNSGGADAATSKDSGTGAPQDLDATTGKDSSTGADSATTGTGSAASSTKSDGCTASPSASQPGALALLLVGLFGLVRRRKQVGAHV